MLYSLCASYFARDCWHFIRACVCVCRATAYCSHAVWIGAGNVVGVVIRCWALFVSANFDGIYWNAHLLIIELHAHTRSGSFQSSFSAFVALTTFESECAAVRRRRRYCCCCCSCIISSRLWECVELIVQAMDVWMRTGTNVHASQITQGIISATSWSASCRSPFVAGCLVHGFIRFFCLRSVRNMLFTGASNQTGTPQLIEAGLNEANSKMKRA